MAKSRYGTAHGHIRALFNVGTFGGLTDGEMLERFTGSSGEVAELAFAALVERHGPMVFRVCQSVLREPHAAQDAFQATFLVLVRKAGSIRNRDSVASWLHGVACRIAACASAAEARRRRHERKAAENSMTSVIERDRDEIAPVLHEELDRLPEKYRAPIVLCHLEGLTHEQTAQRLCWPVGTVRSRLARGRERLRGRLMRRGLALSVGPVKAVLSGKTATAGLPAALAGATALTAVRYASDRFVKTGIVSESVSLLVEGAMNAMIAIKLKFVVLACGLIASGAVVVAQQTGRIPESEARSGQPSVTAKPAARLDATAELAALDASVARQMRQLDFDLLNDEVQYLRERVSDTLRDKVRAEQEDAGASSDVSSVRARKADGAQRAFETSRASYLKKARELWDREQQLGVAADSKRAGGEPTGGATEPDQARRSDGMADKTEPAAATAVGSVDLVAVFKRSEKVQRVNAQYQSDLKTQKQHLTDLEAKRRKLTDQSRGLSRSSQEFVALADDIAVLEKQMQEERETIEREAEQRQSRTATLIYKEIQDVITRVAKAKGLSYVVKVSPVPAPDSEPSELLTALNHLVMYADPRYDLTDEVIRQLNRRFQAASTP
jgi:RNA polymerase sigma factor (sigma-70 family)